MATSTFLWVLAGDKSSEALADRADTLLTRPAFAGATARRVTADELIAQAKPHLRGIDAAWLLGVNDDQQYEAFAALRESGVPAMVTRDDQPTSWRER